jgi:hypothetical protein
MEDGFVLSGEAGVEIKGRTGVVRPKMGVRIEWIPELKSYSLRFDDENNLEFWLEAVIPEEQLEKIKN